MSNQGYIFFVCTVIFLIIVFLIKTFRELSYSDNSKKDNFIYEDKENYEENTIKKDRKLIFNKITNIDSLGMFIVLSNQCVYCRELFEDYWDNLHSLLLEKDIPMYILISEKDQDTGDFLKLFNESFKLLTFDDDFILSNKISTLPSFIIVDEFKNILVETPDPKEAKDVFLSGPNTFTNRKEVIYQ